MSNNVVQSYRTWERILDRAENMTGHSVTSQGRSPASRSDSAISVECSNSAERELSGTITPLDPHNLMESLDQDLRGNSSQVTRKLMRFLGEQFPVGHEKKERDDPDDAPSGTQDPLPSILKIAQQGWVVDEQGTGKRERRAPTLPTAELLPEDAELLARWTPSALQGVVSETTRYFEYGLRGPKRDVARDLDPLQRGMISEQRAQELFDAYFEYIHPQWAMLDPSKHALDLVRRQSAYLTTSILALGSIALATLPDAVEDQVAEALRLRAHVEKLDLVVYSTGARSLEIVQGRILLSRFGVSSRTRLDEQRWVRSAMIPRMAAEIGLGPATAHTHSRGSTGRSFDDPDYWNALRTRAFMILNEYRFFTFSGRCPLDLSYFELEKAEIDQISTIGADHPSASLPALYHLYIFQKEVRRRLDTLGEATPSSTLQLQADLSWVTHYTSQWIAAWCNPTSHAPARWHLLHDALSVHLLLSTRIISRLPQTHTSSRADHQRYLLSIAIRIFEAALDAERGTHMTHRASIFPFAGALILRFSDRRDLVLGLALRMAGDPCRENYVPTFVRSAGNQLLAMLWWVVVPANRGRVCPSGLGTLESAGSSASNQKNQEAQGQSGPAPCAPVLAVDGDVLSQLPTMPVHTPEGLVRSLPQQDNDQRFSYYNSQSVAATEAQPPEPPATEVGIGGAHSSVPVFNEDGPGLVSLTQLSADPPHGFDGADWLDLDASWDFPLASGTPFLTSPELVSGIDELGAGLESAGSFDDVTHAKGNASYITLADMDDGLIEGSRYLGSSLYPDPSPTLSRSRSTVGGGRAADISSGLHEPVLSPTGTGVELPSLDGPFNSDGSHVSRDRDRDGYRETLFLTINRLLEMASAA
ncbi:hypothetical protein BJY00DRAFT_306793 [Aspergillus carlsbadensis]|nr:hypothetical protein BJY00DRAFT_306793 [Aspergillus carlsbadensis]